VAVTEFISELADLVHPNDGTREVFAMFKAYLDESGIHEQAHTCVVAGYTGNVAAWKKFDRAWARLLRNHNVPEFHAQRFWSYQKGGAGKRASPYSDWPEQKAFKFKDEAFSIIQESRIAPVASAVLLEDWNSLTEKQRRFLTGGDYNSQSDKFASPGAPRKGFYLALLGCIWSAVGHSRNGERVHFVLDENKQLAGYALSLFNKLKHSAALRVRQRLGAIVFSTSEEASPIQAADILAYHLMQDSPQMRKQNTARVPSEILDELLTGLRSKNDLQLFNAQGLQILLGDVFNQS
jgi:hypothetical protein